MLLSQGPEFKPQLPVLSNTTDLSAFCVHSSSWVNSVCSCSQSKCCRDGRRSLEGVFYECLFSGTSTGKAGQV